jgi:putative DNA methylase
MSREQQRPNADERFRYPIERGFPIERVNDIAEKEGSSKMHYRPTSMVHKWWARRLGCVFRSICLYTLIDDSENLTVTDPDAGENTLGEFGGGTSQIEQLITDVDLSDPDSLWPLYKKDVRVDDKSVLDPFMGGGTTLMEASRFGADVTGVDLNPVAWFVTKKELEAGETDIEALEAAYEEVKAAVADELRSYYTRSCPNGHDHETDVMYEFWVRELDCISCGSTVPLFKDYRVAAGRYDNKGSYHVNCPECESVFLTDDAQSESVCTECGHTFTPSQGPVTRGGYYTCQDCGQKYSITDAIAEGQSYNERLYAVEYYCSQCDEDESHSKADAKSYIAATEEDLDRYQAAAETWAEREDLHAYVPDTEIPQGAITEASSISGNDVFQHGYETWVDMFNERQLLALALLLDAIDDIDDQNLKEYLLLAFSDSSMFHNNFTIYNRSGNKIEGVFKTNSYNPQMEHIENNVWGCDYGRGTFSATWEKVLDGVRWAHTPTERYIDEDGSTAETGPFETPLGASDYTLHQGDMRAVDLEDTYDAIITDPPYYDNIIYNEVANFFYVWQRQLLADTYEAFETPLTPDVESIATNPALGKDDEDFESDLAQAFSRVHDLLDDEDGILAFTYHHKGSESWGELLEALCDVGFEVTATYPVSADLNKFIQGEAVSFDIIVVARPAGERTKISWRDLKRKIYKTARETRSELQENRTLSQGDIGVMEMGVCFREYSKHHGKVRRGDGLMSAKEVVDEIYGIIQDASDVGTVDVFIDLLRTDDPTYDDVMKLCRGTSANPGELKEMALYNTDDDFELGTWQSDARQAYIQDKLSNEPDELTDLDRLQFLRYEFDRGGRIQQYTNRWEITPELMDLAERLADATDDDVYRRLLGDTSLGV